MKEGKMEENKSGNIKVLYAIMIPLILIILAGGTYAYWSWNSANNTSVTFTASPNLSCSADGGGNITSDSVELMPTAYCNGGESTIKREIDLNVVNSGSMSVYINMWLNVNDIGTNLSNSTHFRYAVTTSSNSCTAGLINSGTFNGKHQGDKVDIISNVLYSGVDKYYLYIWLDEDEENIDMTMESFSFSLGGKCSD